MSGKERPAAIIKDMAHTGKRRVRSKDWVPIVFFLLVSLVLFPVVLPQVACVSVTDVVLPQLVSSAVFNVTKEA